MKRKPVLMLFWLLFALTVAVDMESATAATSVEWEARVVEWEKELVQAQQEIARVKNYPRFRDQELERDKKEKLIYWSQKAVELRDKISEAKTIIIILKEKETYQQIQQSQIQ